MRVLALVLCGLALIQAALVPRPAAARDATEVQVAQAITGPGAISVVAGAVVMPLLDEGWDGGVQALRTTDAIVCASVVTMVLKRLVHEPRPDGKGHDSFPSEHATAAFAAATMAADREPDQAPYWYGAAALVAYSRVRLNRHRPREVVAGALIGYGMAKLEEKMPRGLLIAPFISPDGDGAGVEATWSF